MKEKNIRELAKRMGLISVEDMCQYTIAQLVVKIANKVNELVGEVWRFETDVQEILKTQNENIQYLLGEGLHLEVATVFERWMEDGTFDTLINQTALKKVNDRIDTTNAQLSYVNDNLTDLIVNVKKYGATGDGETNDSIGIQEAINNIQNTGFLFFPDGNYKLDSNVSENGKSINYLMGANVRFSGVGKMPTSKVNSWHQHRGQYLITRPCESATEEGHSTLTSECIPEANFKGNGVAGYFATTGVENGGVSNGGIWALNLLANAKEGYRGAVRACEIDLENYSDDVNGFYGITFWGGGTKNIDGAMLIGRTNFPVTKYVNGVEIRHSLNGLFIHNCDTGVRIRDIDGYKMTKGISIENLEKNAIAITPKNDDSQAQIYGTNKDNTTVKWSVRNDGSANFSSVSCGGGSKITYHHSYLKTVSSQSVNANSQTEIYVEYPSGTNFDVGDSFIATPLGDPGAGLVWSCYVKDGVHCVIRILNPTTVTRTLNNIQWRIDLFKH